jgi:hypothetical protein
VNTCADDARVALPLFQAEYGGSIPTSALQLRVVKVGYQTAAKLNKQWHSRLPSISNAGMCECFAAEFSNIFYAVALWSVPCNQNMHAAGCYELRRLAIAEDAPPNTASRMLAVMRRIVQGGHPEVKRLISYQDTSVHAGTIYKAAGWYCAGKTHKGGACGWNNNVRFRPEDNGAEPLHSVKHRWEYQIRE